MKISVESQPAASG